MGDDCAALAEGRILVVDAAAVEEVAVWRKDGGFRGGGDARSFHPGMFRVENDRDFNFVLAGVLLGSLSRCIGVGLDESEGDVLAFVGRVKTIELRQVRVADGAIGEDEDDDEGLVIRVAGGSELVTPKVTKRGMPGFDCSCEANG